MWPICIGAAVIVVGLIVVGLILGGTSLREGDAEAEVTMRLKRLRQWLRSLRFWRRRPHRLPRRRCPACQRLLAVTKGGVWRHKCAPLLPGIVPAAPDPERAA